MEAAKKTYGQLESEIERLQIQLEEANETIEAIRTGQVDALIVQSNNGHELYTLKTADQTYRIFIEKMTEGAVTLNMDGIILYSNSQFASMVQIPLSQVIGFSFDEFISAECKQPFYSLLKKGWEEDSKGELIIAGKEKNIPVQLSLTALQLDEGFSLSIIVTDLSVQKETQRLLKLNNEELEQINHALELSNHDLQQFASVASHDLQEPLRKILIFSNLLKEKQFGVLTEESNIYLSKIIESSNRMKSLIIDILNYSRLSAGNDQFEPTDLNEIVRELLNDYEVIIEDKKAKIIVPHLPCIDANKGQIRQAFQNLLSNALKFCKEDDCPEITISAARISEKSFDAVEQSDGPFCLIRIQDNGIGFDEQYVHKMFALFERLNSKNKYEGTGIGLAITKKIIEKHNGLITAHGQEGKGAEFLIILPLSQQFV